MNKIYSKIESINGSVITVRAEGVKYNELAEIETAFGVSLAEVNRIDGDLVSLQVFAVFPVGLFSSTGSSGLAGPAGFPQSRQTLGSKGGFTSAAMVLKFLRGLCFSVNQQITINVY